MRAAADATGAAVPDLSAELGESVPAGGAEDAGDGDVGATGVAGAGAYCGAGRQPGELVRAGQGFSGDEADRPDWARAEDQHCAGRGRESPVSMVNDANREMKPVRAETRATAIRIGNPASWRKAANVIEEMG